jgi:hypothetical protein
VTSVIPATLDAEVEGSPSEASSGKSSTPYLKNKLKKAKGMETWLNGRALTGTRF